MYSLSPVSLPSRERSRFIGRSWELRLEGRAAPLFLSFGYPSPSTNSLSAWPYLASFLLFNLNIYNNMDKSDDLGKMASAPVIVPDPSTPALNEQGIELRTAAEIAVVGDEPLKKRSNIRLIAIVVALNVSFFESGGYDYEEH